MALIPDNVTEALDAYLATNEDTPEPSLTYRINFDSGKVSGLVDELDAIRQFVRKAIITCRGQFLIYTDDYGCELENLIGEDVTDAFLQSEVPRMVREALIYDDRIEDITGMSVLRQGDAIRISLTVISIFGDIRQEVTI